MRYTCKRCHKLLSWKIPKPRDLFVIRMVRCEVCNLIGSLKLDRIEVELFVQKAKSLEI